MSEERSSYRKIMQATSLFGGVQVFNILIAVVRSKLIAILLGPSGMGISGLLTSTIQMVGNFTNFGLGTSAVKNVSEANGTGDAEKVSKTVTILLRWVLLTGLLGTVVTLMLSPWLSQIAFGNDHYTYAFMLLAVTLLLSQVTQGQLVLLQGLREIKSLATADIVGVVLSLIVSIPIYYKWGLDGIVPAILVSTVVIFLISWYFSAKIKLKKVTVSKQETIDGGKEMLKIGFMLSLSGLISTGVAYILRIYISKNGGLDQVGLYSAGFTIINIYVGMIFTAMGTDFYPRLSAVSNDNKESKALINQQAEIAILILAPILVGFLVYIKWAIIFLYSTQFEPIVGMVHWATLGIFFKAATWSVGFILLAKGATKLFFWSELVTNAYMLFFNIIGFKYFGLEGLGFSFLLSYALCLLQIYIITHKKYDFSFEPEFYKIIAVQLSIGIICFTVVRILDVSGSYLIGTILIVISSLFSLKELDKRLNLKNIIDSFIKNRINKK